MCADVLVDFRDMSRRQKPIACTKDSSGAAETSHARHFVLHMFEIYRAHFGANFRFLKKSKIAFDRQNCLSNGRKLHLIDKIVYQMKI